MGGIVLMEKYNDTQNVIGKRTSVKSSRDKKTYTFIAKRVEGSEAQAVTIAAYNAGRWAHYAVSKGQHPDTYTTGRNYSRDVMERAAFLRPLVEDWLSNNEVEPAQQLTATNLAETDLLSNESAAVGGAVAGISLKEVSDKYLKHTPCDKLKNVALVAGGRVSTGLVCVWNLGLHGKILAILLVLAVVGPLLYALYYYRTRIVEWVQTVADSLLPKQ
jgi:hypothetical protein